MGAVVDAGASVASGVYHRGATLVTFEFDSFVRQASNPLQSTWDFFSGTGREADCFTGSDAFGGAVDATTMGHTIRFRDTGRLEPGLVQHVYDIESVGGVGFYASYGVFSVACRCYRDNPWEKRAYNISNNFPTVKPRGLFGQWSSSAWSWLTRNWVPPVGPVIGSASQPGSSPSGSGSGGLRPKSGPY